MKLIISASDVPAFLKEADDVKDITGVVVYGESISISAASELIGRFQPGVVEFEPICESEAAYHVPFLIGREQEGGVMLFTNLGKPLADFVKKNCRNAVFWNEVKKSPAKKKTGKSTVSQDIPTAKEEVPTKEEVPAKPVKKETKKLTPRVTVPGESVLLPFVEKSSLPTKRKEYFRTAGALALLESALKKSSDLTALEFQMMMAFGAEYADILHVFEKHFKEARSLLCAE